MDRRLLYAIAFMVALNLFLLSSSFFEFTWDSEAHLFFADHYLRGWFDPWEEKWFGGFWVFSYPPLTHQLIAIFSFPFGLEMGYRIVQGLALLSFPVAMWLLAKEVVGTKYAGWTALLSTTIPGIYIILYTYGQLPSFLAGVLMLIAGAFLARYLKSGRLTSLFGWMFFAGAAVATHHHTVLVVLPILSIALVIQHWTNTPLSFSKWIFRPLIAAGLLVFVVIIAIVPFWWWFFTQNLPQVEIPHPTRENVFKTAFLAELFFWDIYGGILILLPLGFWAIIRRRDLWPIGGLILFLGILGLGGLTPLPKIVFSAWWEWLTYERFALWAAILSVMPISVWVENLMASYSIRRYIIAIPVLMLFLIGATRAATFSLNNQILPKPLERWEEIEIIKFLEDQNHSEWNYVTFGLGEAQFTRLSRLTFARTIDGFYYTARSREELRKSGIGLLDASFWQMERSYDTLFPILQRPWEWNLKWAIVADRWVEEHLRNSGWEIWEPVHPIGSDISFRVGDSMYSKVWVWRVPDKIPVPTIRLDQEPSSPPLLPYLWGTLPLCFLTAGLVVIYWSEIRNMRDK